MIFELLIISLGLFSCALPMPTKGVEDILSECGIENYRCLEKYSCIRIDDGYPKCYLFNHN